MLINQARNLASLPLLRAPAVAAERPAHPAASQPGAEHRLQRPADRPDVPQQWRQRLDVGDRSAAHRRRALALAEHGRRLAGRHARAGRRRRQYRQQPHADVGAGQPEPVGDRRIAGDAGRQPASRAPVAQQLADLIARRSLANGRAQRADRSRARGRSRTGPRAAPPLPDAGRAATSPATPRCSTAATDARQGHAWTARCWRASAQSCSSPSPSRPPRSS